MTDDRTVDQTTGSPAATDTEAVPHWDRKEMEIDDGPGDSRTATGTPDADTALWNKGQMAEESADGSGGPAPTGDIEAPGGLSGEGSNPGGGERWADRDRESS